MQERLIRRYSTCFKRRVISELERGRFASIEVIRRLDVEKICLSGFCL